MISYTSYYPLLPKGSEQLVKHIIVSTHANQIFRQPCTHLPPPVVLDGCHNSFPVVPILIRMLGIGALHIGGTRGEGGKYTCKGSHRM